MSSTASSARCDEPLSWNQFQSQNKGKYAREELSAQWRLYKQNLAKAGLLSNWLKKHNEILKDTVSEKDNRVVPSVASMASSQLPTPKALTPLQDTIRAGDKGKHSGPIGRLYKALKKEAKRLFSSTTHQEAQTKQNPNPDPAYQASLIAAAWAAEAERAAKEAQRLGKEETQAEISRKQEEMSLIPPGPPPRVLRVITREALPHDHDVYFKYFSQWAVVSTGNLRSIRRSIPFEPGIYEWGCRAPGDSRIVAFYLGKAGTLKRVKRRGGGEESIRSRFSHYVRGRVIGPVNEPAKLATFTDLQQRGFNLWFRYRVLNDVEPVDLETWILTRVSYPLNVLLNGPRRKINLPDGRAIEDFPIIK